MQTFRSRRNFIGQFFVLGEPANKLQQDANVVRRGLSDFYSRLFLSRHAPIVADESARGQRTTPERS
jgi:hypothetical protein